jgi:NAD(P)-dependent dehydrogenase (short-subunit alcohol dehydrogenase family)
LVNGRTAERADAAAAELNESGVSGKAIGVAADLSKAEGMDAVLSAIKATGQELDILVCNVGVYGSKAFEETSDEEWERYFQTNIMSTVRPCRVLLPGMLERDNGGRIIIVSSESAFKPLPNMVAYSSTKAMQVNIARGLAELTKSSSVTVNSLMPGPTATEGVIGYFEGMAKEQGREAEEVTKAYFHEHEPTSLKQKLINPDEIANAALYLASAASSATNGCAMRAEGGIYRSV